MEPRELLEVLVAVVATLGEVAATVAGTYGDVLLGVSQRSLHTHLETFIGHLRDTLGHRSVTSLRWDLEALRATLGASRARVPSLASTWPDLVAKLEDSWAQLSKEATELRDGCRDAATREATTAATATALAGDLQEKEARWRMSLNNLEATGWQVPLVLVEEKKASALAKHEARMVAATNEVVAATEDLEEAVVGTSEAGAATKRGQRAEAALGPLELLVAACDKATAFPQELQRRLRDIEAALEGTKEASPDVPESLVAAVAEAKQLLVASDRLARHHLQGTLEDILKLLSSPPGGPSGRAVAKQCQEAIEAIPNLLQGQ